MDDLKTIKETVDNLLHDGWNTWSICCDEPIESIHFKLVVPSTIIEVHNDSIVRRDLKDDAEPEISMWEAQESPHDAPTVYKNDPEAILVGLSEHHIEEALFLFKNYKAAMIMAVNDAIMNM